MTATHRASIASSASDDLGNITKCHFPLSECQSAKSIKVVLEEHNKIVTHKPELSEPELANTIDTLINDTLYNGTYSTNKLLNDFYHIKYDHNIYDDANEFNKFYEFLSSSSDALSCNIESCKEYKYHHRNRDVEETNISYSRGSYNLVCRIHAFCLHPYDHDSSRLIEQQLHNVEETDEQLNVNKFTDDPKQKISVNIGRNNDSRFITSDEVMLDYSQIANVFKNINELCVDENHIRSALGKHKFDRKQLINDLCDGFGNKKDDTILFAQILINEFKCIDWKTRQKVYDLILHGCICKEELTNKNLIPILIYTACEIIPNVNIDQVEQIATDEKLDGLMFVKKTKQFKNSVKFAKLFQSTDNWNKQQWSNVYKAINKWKAKSYENMADDTKYGEQDENEEEIKVTEQDFGQMSDQDIINSFCLITKAENTVAEKFLIHAEWNITFAIDKYYALSGNVTKLSSNYEDDNEHKYDDEQTIYNEGVRFWYWKPRNNDEQQCYIERNYDSLKEEIVMGKLSLHLWNELEKECAILINVDKIKQIVSNGKNEDVYGISAGDPITLQHIYAIKLYTDFTALNWRFCEAFRLKKLTTNAYERIQSLKKRNKMFAVWAKLLIECVQCYGKLGSPNKKYYRGVSQQFMFRKFLARYYVPLSTTKNFQVAVGFTQETGMVMELKKYNNYVSSFACSMLSDFDNEKETLFFGEGTILRINSLYMYDSGWQNFKHYVDAIEQILNIVNGSISWSQTNNMKHVIGSILPKLYNNCTPLPQYIESLLKYHLQHLPYQIEYDFSELAHSHQWVKDIFVKNNEENIPNVCNMCNLFENCDHISITMSDSLTNFIFNSFCESVITDIFNVINKNVTIEFRFSSMNIPLELDAVFQKYSQQHVNLILHTKVDDTAITICPIYVNSPPEEITLDEDEVKRNPIWRSNEDRTVARWQNRLVDGYLRIQQQDIFSVESRYSAYYNLHVVAVVIYKFYNPFLTYPYPETSTVVVVGNYGTGKSSFVKALIGDKHLETNAIKPRENPSVTSSTDNELQLDEPNLIVEAQTIHFGGEQLRIVDTAARDVMGTQQQMQEADIVIVLLNASSNKSIEDFDEYWIEQFNDISL
eukprot:53201_1